MGSVAINVLDPGFYADPWEAYRWVSPISNMRRTATAGHDRHGQRIRAGDEVLVLYGAAIGRNTIPSQRMVDRQVTVS
jgi:hypothetical protein